MLAQSGPSIRSNVVTAMPVEDRTKLVPDIEPVPCAMPVYLEPSIHFWRPTATISETWRRVLCLLGMSPPSRSDVQEVHDQPVHTSRDQGGFVMIT